MLVLQPTGVPVVIGVKHRVAEAEWAGREWVWRLHRAIGMGGDQLVSAVAGRRFEDEHGDDVRAGWAEELDPMLGEVRPFDGVLG